MGMFCTHVWKCDPQGHRDGYLRSVYCELCGSLSRSAEGECADDCQLIGFTVDIPEGYHGACARCSTNDGVHCIVEAVDPPITSDPKFGFPDIMAVRKYVCDACLRPEDELAKEGEE